jgi:serpin B
MTLVNAIYLKAPWLVPFIDGGTQPGSFSRPDRTTVQAQLMQKSGSLPYAEASGWRAVELPYAGGSLAMTVIVPDDLAAFEASLDADGLAAVVGALQARHVELTFPRFGIETSAELADILVRLGMPLAFDPDRADFSGLTTAEKLFISAVVHQANIDVDEKGTEAAAATAVGMDTGGGPSPLKNVTFLLDHPFLFVLRDVGTGAVLFMGRVVDPSVER